MEQIKLRMFKNPTYSLCPAFTESETDFFF